MDCRYPIAGAMFDDQFLLVSSWLPKGQILHLGFPMQEKDETLAIFGIIPNDRCNINTTTYSVEIVQTDLNQEFTGLTCPPGQYRHVVGLFK